ncbi:MAG: hypothetical protein Q8O22_00870 [Candidatus Omnitrophota bacterium]|nr:hypothetical protein [Candidatus Omnitrophota bacterium]
MTGNLWQDWPVYVLMGAVVFFFGYVIIKGNMPYKQNKGKDDNEEAEK